MNITTNNIPRPLVCLLDLPEKADQGDFDYLGPDEVHEYRLVQYKGVWYDVYDSTCCPAMDPSAPRNAFSGWDGYISDSYSSGVLFRLADDDRVVCATYTC